MFLSKLRNKKEVISWSFYDFANQPFTTIIVTFVYGAFFTKVIVPENEELGTLLWTQGISITAIVVALLSPILGALADKGGYRKFFLIFFTWICAVFSILLYFPQSGDIFFALSLFVIANIAFEMGTVFCNSYLSDLSDEKNSGKISGFAWGVGFVGGLLALFLSLSLFELDSDGIRRINILVGVWFLIFSIPTFLFVKDRKKEKLTKKHFADSFSSIKTTFKEVVKYRVIMKFLIARLFFNDGLITIFSLGGIYAIGTLDFSIPEVMILGIVLNISAAIGSFVFGYLEDNIGVKKVINISLIVLVLSTFLAFIAPYFTFQKEIFWIAGVLIGLMVGPNQSCSRSLMAKLTPKDKQNEFFGFFALTGKATSFLGPFLFGIITINFSQQVALWVVICLFLIGLILFNKINFQDE